MVFNEGSIIPEHLREIWPHFVEMRQEKKKPLSLKAVQLILKKLEGYDHATQIRMVEQSIENSWSGVFPVKNQSRAPAGRQAPGDTGGIKPEPGKYDNVPFTKG